MSTMVVELYEALKEAGASDEKAKAAAVAMANFDSRFNHIDSELVKLDKKLGVEMEKINGRIVAVEAELKLVKWGTGAVFAGMATLVLKAFWPH